MAQVGNAPNFVDTGVNANLIHGNIQLAAPQVAIATNYARIFSRLSRCLLEITLFVHASLSLVFLIYVQQHFLASPLDCIERQPDFRTYLESFESKQPLRDYVVRVHAQHGVSRLNMNLAKSVALEQYLLYDWELIDEETSEAKRKSALHFIGESGVADSLFTSETASTTDEATPDSESESESEDLHKSSSEDSTVSFFPISIFEYASSVGYIHLDHEARSRLNLTVLFFVLDLSETGENYCVRSSFERALFDWFAVLSYDELVLSALRTYVSSSAHLHLTDTAVDQSPSSQQSESDTNETVNNETVNNTRGAEKGYIKNLLHGELYQLVGNSKFSRSHTILVPLAAMIVFTGAVSMLLQYARAHVSLLYVTLLHVAFELLRYGLTVGARRPLQAQADADAMSINRQRQRVPLALVSQQLAPTINVLLAFIGVQTMMIEFFESEVTALGVMMLVWLSGEYVLLLRSDRGRATWSRCFYLCHILVYVFHYRFSGHYTELALYTSFSWMLFFMMRIYHAYELPLFTLATRRPATVFGNT